MKLSEVRGERVFDVVADIIDPLAAIATCPEAKEMLSGMDCPEGADPREWRMGRIRQTLPKLIREQKANVVAILASIGGVKPEDYMRDMTLGSLMADIIELLNDEAFSDFFTSLNSPTA